MTFKTGKDRPVVVGQRYYLGVPNLRHSHPLRGLGNRVEEFTRLCTIRGVAGKDPIGVVGTLAPTVEILRTGYTVDNEPSLLHMADPTVRRHPPALKRPVPGALVHLARWADEVIEEQDFIIPLRWLHDIDTPLLPGMRRMLEDEAREGLPS
jgi:hypothetical protein